MAKIMLSNKRKADELLANENSLDGFDHMKEISQATKRPPNKSRKTSASKTRTLLPKTTEPIQKAAHGDAGATCNEASTAPEAEQPAVATGSALCISALVPNDALFRPAAKDSQPKKRQIKRPDVTKDESPDAAKSPKDSVIDADTTPPGKSKKAIAKTKKRSPSKTTAKTSNKKKKEAPAVDMPPSPLPPPLLPALVNQQVANKTKQVLKFVNSEAESDSRLERDPNNRDLISVPYSSLVSAILRMHAHYEISQSARSCTSDAQEVVVQYFKRDIGPTQDVDWVTIDASKTSTFECNVQQKIARHGLDDVNLFEIELELTTKELLERTSLFRDKDGARLDGETLLRPVAGVWEEAVAEHEQTQGFVAEVPKDERRDRSKSKSSETLEGGNSEGRSQYSARPHSS